MHYRSKDRSPYPDFIFLTHSANPKWAEIITRVINRIDFEDRQYFNEFESLFFRMHRQIGFENAMNELKNAVGETQDYSAFKFHIPSTVGEVVFRMMQPDDWALCPLGPITRAPLPIHDVEIIPSGKEFLVLFSSLKRGRTGGYISARDIRHKLNGIDCTVSYSEHAIENIYRRIVGQLGHFGSWGDAYAFFDRNKYFQIETLHKNQSAVSLFQSCFFEQLYPGMRLVTCEYAMKIVGVQALDLYKNHGVSWYYKVGYCPMAVEGGEIQLKTMLPPGYTATPEYGKIMTAKISKSERGKLIAKTDDWTSEKLHQTWDFDLFKWFH